MSNFTTVEDVCDLVTDGTHYTPKNVGLGIPFLTVKDVTDVGLDFTNCSFISDSDYQIAKLGNSAPQKGDVLFSKDGTVGKVHIVNTDKPFAVLSSLAILRPNKKLIESQYLGNVLRLPLVLDDALKRKTGSAIRRIILADLKRVRFPLPSLEEQRRIAEILDRTEELRSKRREAIAQLDTLTQAIFLEMFGDPVTNLKGWKRLPFAELLTNIDSGWSPVCLDRPVSGEEWGVLKLGAVTWCEYNPTENKALPLGVEPNPALEVKNGDLLFTRKNTYELVAACAMVRETPPRLLMSDLIFRFRLRADAAVNPYFLHQLLIYPTKRRNIQKLAGGSASSMPNISKAKLQTTRIEIPPLDLQKEFAHRVEAVEKLKASHRASLSELDTLFASLQNRAFRGEL